MTHVRVWKFLPPPERVDEFAESYASDGAWARLFRQAKGFIATELYRPAEPGGWWLTIDHWLSQGDFETFQRDQGDAYRALDAQLEGLAGDQIFVGAFEDPEQ